MFGVLIDVFKNQNLTQVKVAAILTCDKFV